MIVQPHHDGSPLHVERQAAAVGDTVRIRLRVPPGYGNVEGVWVRSLRDAEPHYDAAVLLGAGSTSAGGDSVASSSVGSSSPGGWQWWEATLTIVNPMQLYRWVLRVDGRTHLVNAAGHFTRDVPDAQDFRIIVAEPAPDWVHRSVMYQIFPDRFARSAAADVRPVPDWAIPCEWDTTPVIGSGPETPYQFYGGDLEGARSKLDHIQALGATVVYLTPMFPARSNHRYDASDFLGVDPLLGGDEEFIRLVEECHARGLKVIGDLTTNHSGDAHEWFRSAYRNPGAPETGYYYFNEDNTEYVAWFGVESLPKFNWASEGLRRRFILDDDSMVCRWLRPPFNLDGWRIDVANMTGRMGDDDFNHEVASLVRETVRRVKPDAMLVAESTSDAARDFQGDTWHGAMTYTNFTRPLWQWLAPARRVAALPADESPAAGPDDVVHPGPDGPGHGHDGAVHPGSDGAHGGHHGTQPVPRRRDYPDFFGLPQRGPDRIEAEDFLDTHLDFAACFPWGVRLANLNAIDTHDTARAAFAMVPGGQRVAVALQFTLPGVPMVFMGDEFGLHGYNGEDSRVPMPWDSPARIREDLRGLYAEASRLRATHPALTDGGIRWLHAEGDAVVFVREHAEESVLVVAARLPFSGLELPLELVGGAPGRLAGFGGDIRADVRAEGAGAVVVFEGHGPAAALFTLPGVAAPNGTDPAGTGARVAVSGDAVPDS